jgi:hypothetical protein
MKAYILPILICVSPHLWAEEERWYDAEGNLARVLPVEPQETEWVPRWEKAEKNREVRFTWDTRRPYVRYSRAFRGSYPYWNYSYACPKAYYPYRYSVWPRYGLRGYYSSSGDWYLRIGK